MSKTREALRDALTDAIESGRWERIPSPVGITVRWSRTRPTPSWARLPGRHGWPADEYDSHVFITVIPGKRTSVVLGTSRAPWVRRRDQHISMTRAMEILANPQGCLD
jgi:hypothetical protein